MALKKSQLYSSLWSSCDELRGGMDASQYKDYILTLLFMKYVSDKYAGTPDALIEVPEGGSFADMVKLKGDKEIGDKINKIIGRFAEASELKGVIDQVDFNDEDKLGRGKEMQDRLSRLVAIFDGLDFRANRAEGDDLLGDAYEYLMRHFATESGKSKGQFYTPAEVSRVIAKVIGIGPGTPQDQAIYDPTCGSGSLLLKAAAEAPRGVTIYGQEMDNATWALARMNMILHGYPTAELWRGNTLAAPYFKNSDGSLMSFDFAVANPPFSAKAWTHGLAPDHDEFGRFEHGVPPAKNGDYAFLLHLIKSLRSRGKGAIILPHGVLFRGHKEADIRRHLVQRGLIKGIIGLPANLFYGTGIPACILVIDKGYAHARTGLFMIDASKGFMKDGNKNRLRSQDIHKIVDVFNRQIELPRYSRMVPVAEIASPANDYNLNIPRYVDASEPEDLHDLDAHLNGGIPDRDIDALDAYWTVFPSLRGALFKTNSREGYSEARAETQQIKATILAHEEFGAYADRVAAIFDGWLEAAKPHAAIDDKDRKIKETPDLTIGRKKYKMDLIPPALIVARYFADEQAAIDELQAGREAAARELEERYAHPLPELEREVETFSAKVEGHLKQMGLVVKQATMQQLLTGKTRLPGFSEEWKTKTLGEIADIKNGATPSTQVAAYWNGTIPWCTPTDITGTPKKYLMAAERSITAEGLASCAASLLPVGALLLCSRATIGEVKIAGMEVCTNQGFKALVCRDGVSNKFLYYLLLTLKPQMIERAIGSTFLEIGKRDVASIQVKLPNQEGQSAIATILSDMDAEIAALERRRDKTKQIKQGMMQQLLTGRVRLVKPQAEEASI